MGFYNVIGITLIVVVLLFFSAFLSACEMAFSSINKVRLINLAENDVKGARLALKFVHNYEKTLTTILVGNNFINIATTTICAYLFSQLIKSPTISNIVNTVLMTIIILFFCEIIPKTIAKINSEKFVLNNSVRFYFISKILYPFMFVFYYIQKKVMEKRVETIAPTINKDDLEIVIETMQEEGVFKNEEAQLHYNLLELGNKKVVDIMTPRVDMVVVSKNSEKNDIINIFSKHKYSRLPVYSGDKDNIVGVINYKDFMKHAIDNKHFVFSDIIKPIVFVGENMGIRKLLKSMQTKKYHIAIVVDESGGTSGVVTLEDILEEVVGEIYDEADMDIQDKIIKLTENEYEVDASIKIMELFDFLQLEYVPNKKFSTLGGYLFYLQENLPIEGEAREVVVADEELLKNGEYKIKYVKLVFVITKLRGKRIDKVKLLVNTESDNKKK